MNKVERIINTIERKEIDYLPSQINIADHSRYPELAEGFGLESASEVDDFLENHMIFTHVLHDYPAFYINDRNKMLELQEMGYCGIDEEGGMIYDCWGMGFQIGSDGVCVNYHPLQGDVGKNERAKKFLPGEFDQSVLDMDPVEALKAYKTPDIGKTDNFSVMEAALAKYGSEMLVIPGGNFGVFERGYNVTGFSEFMMDIALEPEAMKQYIEKLFDFKIAEAKVKAKMGFKMAHYSDDLASQIGPLFSIDTFKGYFLPRLKELFAIYKAEGMYVQMHSCGNVVDFLPYLIDIGLDVLEPVQPCMDLQYLKDEFGKDLTFFGGIDTQRLPFMTPEEAKAHTKEVIHVLGKNGGYIISPSQEVMRDIPLDNIVAMVQAIREERGRVFD